MEDVRNKYVPPTINETAFNCPHCGAFAMQHWLSSHADPFEEGQTPSSLIFDQLMKLDLNDIAPEKREQTKRLIELMDTGRPFIDSSSLYPKHPDYDVQNVFISQCYNCKDIAIWIYDRLIWPRKGAALPANSDLPEDVRKDYEEASTILDLSPGGAAALLRLGIQKLCKHLNQPGHNLNDDIAALVKEGLDIRVQQALDVVRVVGNSAVHPGQIDLKDDRTIAENLFRLVNLIAEKMIGQPKRVALMYNGLPEASRQAIEKRDSRK